MWCEVCAEGMEFSLRKHLHKDSRKDLNYLGKGEGWFWVYYDGNYSCFLPVTFLYLQEYQNEIISKRNSITYSLVFYQNTKSMSALLILKWFLLMIDLPQNEGNTKNNRTLCLQHLETITFACYSKLHLRHLVTHVLFSVL